MKPKLYEVLDAGSGKRVANYLANDAAEALDKALRDFPRAPRGTFLAVALQRHHGWQQTRSRRPVPIEVLGSLVNERLPDRVGLVGDHVFYYLYPTHDHADSIHRTTALERMREQRTVYYEQWEEVQP